MATRQKMEEILGLYIEYGKAKELSSVTLEFYKRVINHVLEQCARISGDALNSLDVMQFFIHLNRDHNASAGYWNLHFRHMKAFYRFCVRQGFCEKSPLEAAGISLKKVTHKMTVLSNESIQKLIERFQNSPGSCRKRNLAIVAFLLETGVRPGELCSITLQDINWDTGEVTVRGKTGERVVNITGKTKTILKDYFRGERVYGSQYYFVDHKGKPMNQHKLRSLFNNLYRRNFGEKLYPYLFRHTFASAAIKNGVDLYSVSSMLGHKNITTTQVYLHPDKRHIKEAVERTSLVGQLWK
jgi:integrase/recombinase XerD